VCCQDQVIDQKARDNDLDFDHHFLGYSMVNYYEPPFFHQKHMDNQVIQQPLFDHWSEKNYDHWFLFLN